MTEYIDILMTDDDIALDGANVPLFVTGINSIAQDIKHLVRETGLLVEMIGQRDDVSIAQNIQRLIVAVEDDQRIVPGTVTIERTDTETFYLAAETIIGDIYLTLQRS